MKRRTVVKWSSLPTHPMRFLWGTAVLWLLMDRFNAPGWAHGVLWTVWGLLFIVFLVGWWHQDYVDINGFGDRTP